jgi:hypothetical protein
MNFHLQFVRNVSGSGSPALGADIDPRTAYGTAGIAPPKYAALTAFTASAGSTGCDNILPMRHFSKIAESYKRVAILFLGATQGLTTTCSLFVWDGLTQHWHLLGSALSGTTLTSGSLVSVTVPTFGEPPMSGTATGAQSQSAAQQPFARNPGTSLQADPGSLALMLRVDAGSLGAGTYQFAMAPSFADNVT